MSYTIAVYGGSFNPPHIGHLLCCLQALNTPGVHQLYVIPCFQQKGKELADFRHRLRMCEKLVQDLPRTRVLTIEAELGGESLTYRTLEELKSQHGDGTTFRLVCGTDVAKAIPDWEGGERVLELATPLIVDRYPVSSTEIREAISRRHMSYVQDRTTGLVFDYLAGFSPYPNGLPRRPSL